MMMGFESNKDKDALIKTIADLKNKKYKKDDIDWIFYFINESNCGPKNKKIDFIKKLNNELHIEIIALVAFCKLKSKGKQKLINWIGWQT